MAALGFHLGLAPCASVRQLWVDAYAVKHLLLTSGRHQYTLTLLWSDQLRPVANNCQLLPLPLSAIFSP